MPTLCSQLNLHRAKVASRKTINVNWKSWKRRRKSPNPKTITQFSGAMFVRLGHLGWNCWQGIQMQKSWIILQFNKIKMIILVIHVFCIIWQSRVTERRNAKCQPRQRSFQRQRDNVPMQSYITICFQSPHSGAKWPFGWTKFCNLSKRILQT